MTFDSQRLRLNDVANIVGGGTPSTSNAEYWGGNIPWLTPKDLSSNNEVYVAGGERYISKKGLQESSAKLLPTGSVLFSSRAPIGYIAIAKNEIATNQGFKSLKVNNEHNNIYFYYLLKHLTPYIQSIATGSTFKEISGNDLGTIEVDVPSLNIQKKISHCLLTLDKKISNLRAINQTLESIAQAIFKSWFIDFDPVRAKQQGKECAGIDKATADIFPNSFVESELGLIPKGWTVVSFKEVIEIYDSKRIPLSSRERQTRKGGFPYYGAASIMDYIDDYIFEGTFLLMGEDGTVVNTNNNPVLQYVSGRFWANNHAHVLQGKNNVSTEHIMLFLQRLNIQPYLTGAVQLKISQTNLWRIKFLLSSKNILNAFNNLTTPIFSKLLCNIGQIKTLTSIRDTLLPRLISGKLDLSNIEEELEGIA